MSFENRYVVRRFILKVIILAVFAAVQWPHGNLFTIALLFGFAGVTDIGLALLARTPFRHTCLTYWDEAAVFLSLNAFMIGAAHYSR